MSQSNKQPSKVKFISQTLLNLEVKIYQPVIEDLEHRVFDYLHVEDNGNIVRLGNRNEEFTFYDLKFTETFVGFCESLKTKVTKAKMHTSTADSESGVCTEVCITVSSNQELQWGGSESISFSWLSDNVKIAYVPKEPYPYYLKQAKFD